MNFKEVEKESNSAFYRVYDIYQSIDESKRYKRDLFNYEKAKEKESQLSRIKCPFLGRREGDDRRSKPDDNHN